MTMTTTLLNQVRDDIKDDLEPLFTHGAVGDDNTASTAGDTALGNETFIDAIDAFDTAATGKVTASLRVELNENNGNDVKETGWFNAAASGTMWTRNVLTTIAKTGDITLFFDTTITITVTES